MICDFTGCRRDVVAKGLCNGHYLQQRRGERLRALRGDASLADRLAAKTDRSGDCWIWTDRPNAAGYGVLHYNGKNQLAHRLAYELAVGPIDNRLVLDHKCHTPACVRPDHLQPVTHKQNAENRSGATRVNASGVRGVTRRHGRAGWVGKVRHGGRLYHAGYFDSIEEAEVAVIALRNHLFTNNLLDRETSHPATLDNLEASK